MFTQTNYQIGLNNFGLPFVEHDNFVLVGPIVDDMSEGQEGGSPR